MSSSEYSREQARDIHRTIRMIKENLVRKHLERHRAMDDAEDLCASLTFPQFNALMALRDSGTVSIKELAESLHVSAPSASTMVDRLVDLGVVAREQNPEDRRTVCVQLTVAGANALQEMEEALLGEIVRLFGRLGPEMSAQWVAIYRRIAAILDEDARNADGVANAPSEDA